MIPRWVLCINDVYCSLNEDTILFQEGVEYPYRKLDNIHRVGYDPYFKHGRSEGFTSEEEFNKYFEIIDPTKNISEQ